MRTVHSQFNEKNLTGNAGLTLFGKFAKKIKLSNILENNVSIARSPQAEYSGVQSLLVTNYKLITV